MDQCSICGKPFDKEEKHIESYLENASPYNLVCNECRKKNNRKIRKKKEIRRP